MSAITLNHDTTLKHADAIAAWRDTGFLQALRGVLLALGERFDRWTDPRDETEGFLARAQNHADLEQRMRVAFINRGGFGF
jgi:hypothetical protein